MTRPYAERSDAKIGQTHDMSFTSKPLDRPLPQGPEGQRPIYTRASLWTAVGAVALASVGVASGLLARSSYDEWKDLDALNDPANDAQLTSLEDDTRDRAILANVSFALAGATAVVAGVLFYFEGRADRSEERAVTLMPARGGGHRRLQLELLRQEIAKRWLGREFRGLRRGPQVGSP